MATITLPTAINKFLKRLLNTEQAPQPALDDNEKASLREIIGASPVLTSGPVTSNAAGQSSIANNALTQSMVSGLTSALAAKANYANQALYNCTADTPDYGDDSAKLATTAFVVNLTKYADWVFTPVLLNVIHAVYGAIVPSTPVYLFRINPHQDGGEGDVFGVPTFVGTFTLDGQPGVSVEAKLRPIDPGSSSGYWSLTLKFISGDNAGSTIAEWTMDESSSFSGALNWPAAAGTEGLIGIGLLENYSISLPPKFDPRIPGAIWNNAGTLAISAG